MPEKEKALLFYIKIFVALIWYLGTLTLIHVLVIKLGNHAKGLVSEESEDDEIE